MSKAPERNVVIRVDHRRRNDGSEVTLEAFGPTPFRPARWVVTVFRDTDGRREKLGGVAWLWQSEKRARKDFERFANETVRS